MAFLLRLFSRSREAPQDVVQLREEFASRKNEIDEVLLQNGKVRALVEVIFDNASLKAQFFLLSPSVSWLRENQEFICQIFSGLASYGVSLFGRLADVIQEYGVETVSDIVVHVLKLLNNLLSNKLVSLGDSLRERLDYGWQLSSPLSGKPKQHFLTHQQSRNRQNFQPGSPCQEHDGTTKIVRYMDESLPVSHNDKEQEEEDTSRNTLVEALVDRNTGNRSSVAACENKQEEELPVADNAEDSDTGLRTQIMRVETPPHDGRNTVVGSSFRSKAEDYDCERTNDGSGTGNSSLANSKRMSYGGSLYTTDSDDDSNLSTSSRMSLLVAVSEAAQDSDSCSEADSDLLELEPDNSELHDYADNATTEAENAASDEDLLLVEGSIPDGGDESAEDKLPICSSVVLSGRNSSSSANDLGRESFYTPEMWTYSDKDANDFEADNEEDESFVKDIREEQKQRPEEVKVVIEAGFEDKHVSVCVHPVSRQGWGVISGEGQEDTEIKLPSLPSKEAFAQTDQSPISGASEGCLVPAEQKTSVNAVEIQAEAETESLVEDGTPVNLESVTVLRVDEVGSSLDTKEVESGVLKVADNQLTPEDHLQAENLVDEEAANQAINLVDQEDSIARDPGSTQADNTAQDSFRHLDVESLEAAKELREAETIQSSVIVGKTTLAESQPGAENHAFPGSEEQTPAEVRDDSKVSEGTETKQQDQNGEYIETGKKHAGPQEPAMKTFSEFLKSEAATSKSLDLSSKFAEATTEALLSPHSGLIPVSGPIVYNSHSGPIPYSGSLSLRSDSSTTSTRSFAFPILSTDWASSPVKMAPPDRKYSRHKLSWRWICCLR